MHYIQKKGGKKLFPNNTHIPVSGDGLLSLCLANQELRGTEVQNNSMPHMEI